MPRKPNHSDSFLEAVEAGTNSLRDVATRPAGGVKPQKKGKKKLKAKPDPAVAVAAPAPAPAKPAPSKGLPSAPVAMPEPVVDFPYDPKDQDEVTRDVARFDAVGDSHFSRERYDGTPAYPNEGGQHYLRPIALPADPFGGGGELDPRDPTSFDQQRGASEPAWDKRERDMAARAMLRRQLRAAQARGPMGP